MKSNLLLIGAFTLLMTIAYSQADCPQAGQCQTPTCPANYNFNGSTCVRFVVATPSYGLSSSWNWGGNTQPSTP